jgi:hypothetical protein
LGEELVTYTPLRDLNTDLIDWKIKAMVLRKYPRKELKNRCGSLMGFVLIDDYGKQIEGTLFDDQGDCNGDPIVE